MYRYIVCPANSSHNFWVKTYQNVGMDIEDVHLSRILIFFHIWENYRIFNFVIYDTILYYIESIVLHDLNNVVCK
jgi:hypothetical protein